ncbi:MAG: hypothetical protein G01um101438_179 [Parcubacteria group bacterium Gr01-1014_38]|nr:MAG: hypothetical protein G01um101438_179 [Parcubacteria group bacterium Gr01-1014_38]
MIPFFGAFTLSLALGSAARWGGERIRLTAARGVAATGGISTLLAWWILSGLTGSLSPRSALGMGLATITIVAVGLWDLWRGLGPLPQLLGQLLASIGAVFVGGIAVEYVTNPTGGLITLDHWQIGGFPFPGAALTVLWILVLMNAVNFLDGMDGLAATVSTIGFLAIGVTSLLPQVNEPVVALPAFLAAAATAGFLFWNFPPARLVLGTPGAWFLGFLLAVLSVQGSSKIATLSVVGAIPLLDAVSVVTARIRRGSSPFRGDRTHFHHRLLAKAWSPRSILALYTVVSAGLAVAAVTLPTPWKVLLLAASGAAVIFFTLTRRPTFLVDGKGKNP